MTDFVSGHWLMDDRDGTYSEGFEVEITGTYSYGVEFNATRAVLERIAQCQDRYADEIEGKIDRLKWDGDVLIHTGGDYDPEYSCPYKPGDDGRYHGLGFGWVWSAVDAGECDTVWAEDGQQLVDSLLDKYASELQKIYDNRTAGDYTFLGVLASYTNELKQKGVQLL